MTNELEFIATFTLIFICLVFLIGSRPRTQPQEEIEKDEKVKHNIPKEKILKSEEVIDTLDWMLKHGIITTQEYTKLIGKCLPFLQ